MKSELWGRTTAAQIHWLLQTWQGLITRVVNSAQPPSKENILLSKINFRLMTCFTNRPLLVCMRHNQPSLFCSHSVVSTFSYTRNHFMDPTWTETWSCSLRPSVHMRLRTLAVKLQIENMLPRATSGSHLETLHLLHRSWTSSLWGPTGGFWVILWGNFLWSLSLAVRGFGDTDCWFWQNFLQNKTWTSVFTPRRPPEVSNSFRREQFSNRQDNKQLLEFS